MAKRIESHITVLYEIPVPQNLDRLVRAARPLRLRATAVEQWSSEPGIFIAVTDPHGDLNRFRLEVLGVDDPGFRPHITLLHRESVTSPQQTRDAWAELNGARFDCEFAVTELVIYEEIEGGWRVGGRLRFGQNVS